MNLIEIGSHAINLDRVADIWEEHDGQGNYSGRVLVFCGDYTIKLEGAEAELLKQFKKDVAKRYTGSLKKVRVTGDLSGVDLNRETPG